MATATERRARRATSFAQSPNKQKPQRRWRFRILAAVACLVTLIAILPALVSRSPVAGWLLSKATSDLHGSATVGAVHLGWFSAPVLADLEICDSDQQCLIAIEHVRAEQSLLSLLLNGADLGRIRIEKPRVSITYDGSTTNLEEVFGPWLTGNSEPLEVAAELVVTDGAVSLTDTRSGRKWQANELELTAALPAESGSPIDLRTSGHIAAGEHTGRFAVELALNQAASDDDPLFGIETLKAQLENTPLEMLAPLLARSMPDTELGGCLSAFADCEAKEGTDQPEASIRLTASIDNFVLSGASLKGDRLAIDRVELGGHASWRGRFINVEGLRLETELGNVSVNGGFDLPDGSFSTLVKSLAEQTYRIEAGVNLAALAASLPNTLRLQQGMQIQSGGATIVLESRQVDDDMHWEGRADISDLAAKHQGRSLNWREPIQASLSATRNTEGLSLERLECRAEHLQINASGTPERVDGAIDFDLAGLTKQAAQWIDLAGLRLAGTGHGRFQWSRQSQQDYAANGNLQINGFQLALGDRPGWSEEKVELKLEAQGPIGELSAPAIGSGTAQLSLGDDRVMITLAEPVKDAMKTVAYPLNVESKGDLGRWSARLQSLMPQADWQVAGHLKATGRVDCGTESTTVRNGKIRVEQCAIRSPYLNFFDPDVEITVGQAKWLSPQHRLEISSTALAGQTIGVGVDPFAVAWSGATVSELNGAVAIRTTLDRMQQWGTVTMTAPPKWMLRGNVAGKSTFRTIEGKVAVEADLTVEQFSAHHPAGQKLEDPKIRVIARGQYVPETQLVELERARLESGIVAADASGSVDLAERTRIDIDGQYEYDLVRLSEMGRTYLGFPLFAAGRGTSPFSYHGPISLAEAEASLGLRWTGAEMVGLLIGQGAIDAQLAGGTLHANPIELDVSEGRMTLTPQVSFSADGSVLNLDPGRVAERIRISPRMCDGALQYIAPPLAGVTSAEGTFSIEMEQCRIPLGAPEKGDLTGRMTVHAVSVGPGPLIRELATALGFGGTARLNRESVVPFRMVDGRVYHRDLELVFPEVTMKTYGSVGLDQSLALMVEMPIPDKWRSSNPMLNQIVQNQTLRLPIGGSLQKPVIDRRELERQAGQFLQGAVQNALEGQLNRQLERLFKSR